MSQQLEHLLLIGDLHFKTAHLIACDQLIAQVEQLVRSTRFHSCILLGDILHYHGRLEMLALNKVCALLDTLLAHIQHTVYVLVGNHDALNNAYDTLDTQHHWLNVLKRWPRVTIVDRPHTFCILEQRFLCMPYVRAGTFHATCARYNIALDTIVVCFAHQEFDGVQLGGVRSTCGERFELDTNTAVCISGHIHERHAATQRLFYVGAAFDHSFTAPACFLHTLTVPFRSLDDSLAAIPIQFRLKRVLHARLLRDNAEIEFDASQVDTERDTPATTMCLVECASLVDFRHWMRTSQLARNMSTHVDFCFKKIATAPSTLPLPPTPLTQQDLGALLQQRIAPHCAAELNTILSLSV